MQKKILVLDDDDDLLEIMDFILSDAGYTVLALKDGDHIIENIIQFGPNLILMDVMLNDMDGRLICENIKANKAINIPVILVSGTHNLAQVMGQLGAPDDFISKPFDLDELLNKVAVQIAQPHLPFLPC